MPSSGGSVSDAPVNKVVDGKSHYLAYITPDEGKSLVDQGGKEVVTDSGIPAYPPPGERGGGGYTGSSSGAPPGEHGGSGPTHQEQRDSSSPSDDRQDSPPSSRQPGLETATSTVQQEAQQQDIRDLQTRMDEEGGATAQDYVNIHADPSISLDVKEDVKESIVDQILNGTFTKTEALNLIQKVPGLLSDNKFVAAMGSVFGIAMAMGGKAQEKAIVWDLNKRLQKEYKIEDDPRYRTGKSDIIQDRIRRAKLPRDDPDHYSQTDYMKDYPGPRGDVDTDGGDNDRGLVNIITPYAAHGIGGTTQQPSQAAQWYSTLGSSPSNPGAFNLTAQYAKAKAAVSQRLGNPTSVGQLAVNNSPFYNWLKDNSLNKGIL